MYEDIGKGCGQQNSKTVELSRQAFKKKKGVVIFFFVFALEKNKMADSGLEKGCGHFFFVFALEKSKMVDSGLILDL